MTITIKSNVEIGNNYNRFGRNLPKEETEIDVENYFKVKKDRAEYIVKKLQADKKLTVTIKEEQEIKPLKKQEKVIEKTEETEETTEPETKPTRGRKAGK